MRRTVSITAAAAAAAAAAVAVAASIMIGGPASAATPPLRFHGVQYDSPGTDNRSAASLNAEWISLTNTGTKSVNLTGYTIRDKANHVYTFGNVTIPARSGRIWLRTGKGTDSGVNRFWNSGNYIWNNTGDTAYLRTGSGTTLDTCSWSYRSGRTWVGC